MTRIYIKKAQLDKELYLRTMNENQGQKKADKEKYQNDLYITNGAHDNVHALIFLPGIYVFNGLANISLSLCTNIFFLAKHYSYYPLKFDFFLNFTFSLVIDMLFVSKLHLLFTIDTNQIKELQDISIQVKHFIYTVYT